MIKVINVKSRSALIIAMLFLSTGIIFSNSSPVAFAQINPTRSGMPSGTPKKPKITDTSADEQAAKQKREEERLLKLQQQKKDLQRKQQEAVQQTDDVPSEEPTPKPTPTTGRRGGRTPTVQVRQTDPNIFPSGVLRLPYRVEVGGDRTGKTPQQVVTLSVGAATVFKCPEAVLQVVFGNKEGLGFTSSTDETPRPDFYLRPTKAGLRTNMLVEMASSTVIVSLKTIAITGGPQAGDYHAEVVVYTTNYKDNLGGAMAKLAELERVNAEQKAQLAKSAENVRIATSKGQDSIKAAAIKTIVTSLNGSERRKLKDVDSLEFSHVTTFRDDRTWWVLISIDNKGKKPVMMDALTLTGGRLTDLQVILPGSNVSTQSSDGGSRQVNLPGKSSAYLLMILEPEVNNPQAMLELKFLIDSKGYSVSW